MKVPELRVIDKGFNLVGILDTYTSFQGERRAWEVGPLEMHIDLRAQGADACQVGNIVMIDESRAWEITGVKKSEGPGLGLQVTGQELKGILGQRIVIPAEKDDSHHFGWDRVPEAGDPDVPVETIIKHYVNKHAINPSDAKRKLPGLVLAPDQKRGMLTRWSERFQPLTETLKDIGEFSGMGYTVTVDLENKRFVLDVIPEVDQSTDYLSTLAQSYRVGTPTEAAPLYPTSRTAWGQSLYALTHNGVKVQDEITADGKLIKRIGVITINGTEGWGESGSGSSMYFYLDLPTPYETYVQDSEQSSHYKPSDGVIISANTVTGIRVWNRDESNTDRLSVRPIGQPYANVAAYKTWLAAQHAAGKPLTVYAVLTTPVTTDLPQPPNQTREGATPVILAADFENIQSLDFTHDVSRDVTIAYAGGAGEDEDRLIQTVARTPTDTSLTGYARREGWLECGSVEEIDDLIYEAQYQLAQQEKAETLTCQALPNASFEYRVDWDVGSIVTVRSKALGLTQQQKVTAVRETYERGKIQITPTLGKRNKTILDEIRKTEVVK